MTSRGEDPHEFDPATPAEAGVLASTVASTLYGADRERRSEGLATLKSLCVRCDAGVCATYPEVARAALPHSIRALNHPSPRDPRHRRPRYPTFCERRRRGHRQARASSRRPLGRRAPERSRGARRGGRMRHGGTIADRGAANARIHRGRAIGGDRRPGERRCPSGPSRYTSRRSFQRRSRRPGQRCARARPR